LYKFFEQQCKTKIAIEKIHIFSLLTGLLDFSDISVQGLPSRSLVTRRFIDKKEGATQRDCSNFKKLFQTLILINYFNQIFFTTTHINLSKIMEINM
jgi:hypothetical protein